MEWISVKDRLPPCGDREMPYILAFHTVFGIGVAWFWEFEVDGGDREMLEEEFQDKYLCSCYFIKNITDGNYCIDDEDNIHIFEHSAHFANLGTVTHWMPLPIPPALPRNIK